MKKLITISAITIFCLAFTACNNNKESVESIAKKWCDLNAKVRNAESGSEEKEKAKEAREKYENEIEAKYKSDKEFYDKISEETKKCDQ